MAFILVPEAVFAFISTSQDLVSSDLSKNCLLKLSIFIVVQPWGVFEFVNLSLFILIKMYIILFKQSTDYCLIVDEFLMVF